MLSCTLDPTPSSAQNFDVSLPWHATSDAISPRGFKGPQIFNHHIPTLNFYYKYYYAESKYSKYTNPQGSVRTEEPPVNFLGVRRE